MQVLSHSSLFALADFEDFAFQLLTLGNIAHDANHARETTGMFPYGKPAVQHPADGTIRAYHTVRMFVALRGSGFREKLTQAGAVFRVNPFEPGTDRRIAID